MSQEPLGQAGTRDIEKSGETVGYYWTTNRINSAFLGVIILELMVWLIAFVRLVSVGIVVVIAALVNRICSGVCGLRLVFEGSIGPSLRLFRHTSFMIYSILGLKHQK